MTMEQVPASSRRQGSSGRPRKRALEACNFCRGRKLKCSGEMPVCINCKTYGKDCHYQPLSDADRAEERRKRQKKPTHGARAPSGSTPSPGAEASPSSLDARAPQQPPHQQQRPPHQQQPPPQQQQQQQPTPRTARSAASSAGSPSVRAAPRGHGVSRIVVSANGIPSYHGRTSALFEENLQDRPVPARPKMPDEWVERALVTEASKQRQLEDYHYHAGLLDFDGVDPEVGMHLLRLHWNRQHHSFLITYRPAFMRDMACNGPYFSKLLLNAIYFGASRFSPKTEVRRDVQDVRTAGWKFRERVRELLGSALDRSEITTIQALLIMTSSLFALGDERSAAWLYAGLAFRMITDLGLHVDVQRSDISSRRYSDEDLEIRRRVFWGAFVVDKMQSLYQGRPVTLKESDASVPIKFLDTYEELDLWTPFSHPNQTENDYRGTPTYSISTFTMLSRLSVTMSDILGSIYNEHSFDQSPEQLSALVGNLNQKLVDWRNSLPEHLDWNPVRTGPIPAPQILSLHAMHSVLVILLHRPFVADGHLYNTHRNIAVNSLMECANAATKIVQVLRAYDRAFSVKRAPYLLSYATYVAATIHARIAAKRDVDSDAHGSLETCLAVFQVNQETNSAAQKAMTIVRGLIQRLGVNLRLGHDGWRIERGRQARTLGKQHLMLRTDGLPSPGLEAGSGQHANSTTRQSSTFTSATSSPSTFDRYDIDGIIQSFGGGVGEQQDASHGHGTTAAAAAAAVTHHQHEMGGAMPTAAAAAAAHMPHQPSQQVFNHYAMPSSLQSQPPGDQTSVGSYVTAQAQASWQHQQPSVVDDLLFGFSNSALDEFSGFNWPY